MKILAQVDDLYDDNCKSCEYKTGSVDNCRGCAVFNQLNKLGKQLLGGKEMAKGDTALAKKMAKENKLSAAEIAKATGCNYQTVYKYCKDAKKKGKEHVAVGVFAEDFKEQPNKEKVDWKEKYKNMKAEHDELLKQNSDLKENREELENDVKRLEDENYKLQQAKEEIEEKHASSQEDHKPQMVAELNRKNSYLQEEITDLHKLLKSTEDELEEANEYIQLLKDQHKEYMDKMGKALATKQEDIELLNQEFFNMKAAHDHLQDYVGALGKVRV